MKCLLYVECILLQDIMSVEATISYNDDLSIEVKETMRSKVASTLQTSMKPVNNLTKNELALSTL